MDDNKNVYSNDEIEKNAEVLQKFDSVKSKLIEKGKRNNI